MIEAYKALAKAQSEMTRAQKGSENPHLKKSYADLGNVQDACIEALHSAGFAVLQPVGHDELGMFVQTVFAHSSGETLECRTPLIVGKNDMQGLGSAITYARRYGLLCMAGIAPEDDDGAKTSGQQRANNQARQSGPPLLSEGHQKDAEKCVRDIQNASDASLGEVFESITKYWTGEGIAMPQIVQDAYDKALAKEAA